LPDGTQVSLAEAFLSDSFPGQFDGNCRCTANGSCHKRDFQPTTALVSAIEVDFSSWIPKEVRGQKGNRVTNRNQSICPDFPSIVVTKLRDTAVSKDRKIWQLGRVHHRFSFSCNVSCHHFYSEILYDLIPIQCFSSEMLMQSKSVKFPPRTQFHAKSKFMYDC
jgi:hypothetical protein